MENQGNLKTNLEEESTKALARILDEEIRFNLRAYPDSIHPSLGDWIPFGIGNLFFHYRTRKEHKPISEFDEAYLSANLLYSGFTLLGALLSIPYLIQKF